MTDDYREWADYQHALYEYISLNWPSETPGGQRAATEIAALEKMLAGTTGETA